MKRSLSLPLVVMVAALFATPGISSAGFLTPAFESKVENWLGEGNKTFNSIFTSTSGDGKTSSHFHAATDGMGRTISLMKVRNVRNGDTGQLIEGEFIIGGYNPLSWSSGAGYNISFSDAERTAFLFNLTTDQLRRQNLNPPADPYNTGRYQTYNASSYGPSFGGGFDISVNSNLENGYAYNYSYGGAFNNNNVFSQQYTVFDVVGVEVYTLSDGDTVATPEPASLVMMGSGVMMMLGAGRVLRRKKAAESLESAVAIA